VCLVETNGAAQQRGNSMGRKKKDRFDDAAFISHLKETLPQEEKDSPLFLAYKASVKPEKERTQKERLDLLPFKLLFATLPLLTTNKKTKKIGLKKNIKSEEVLKSIASAADKLHQELEEMEGRKIPKPSQAMRDEIRFKSLAEPVLSAVFEDLYPEVLKKWEDRKK